MQNAHDNTINLPESYDDAVLEMLDALDNNTFELEV